MPVTGSFLGQAVQSTLDFKLEIQVISGGNQDRT
jgi:hypothetical protein